MNVPVIDESNATITDESGVQIVVEGDGPAYGSLGTMVLIGTPDVIDEIYRLAGLG